MTERTFVAGDKIEFWDINHPDERREAYLAKCSETQEGCQGLHLFHPHDEEMPFADFHRAIVGHPEMFGYELITPFEDALPTEPGTYKEDSLGRIRRSFAGLAEPIIEALMTGIEESGEAKAVENDRWTLNEDGTWTDPEGTTKPASDNWQLVISDYVFDKAEPVAGEKTPFA